jgi:hypothetical protein
MEKFAVRPLRASLPCPSTPNNTVVRFSVVDRPCFLVNRVSFDVQLVTASTGIAVLSYLITVGSA